MYYVPKLYDYEKRTYVIVSEQKFSIRYYEIFIISTTKIDDEISKDSQ